LLAQSELNMKVSCLHGIQQFVIFPELCCDVTIENTEFPNKEVGIKK
jgi:hypothetical protein